MARIIPYLILLPFALAPSIIWLIYFLKKDPHPEPRREIIKIFFWGAVATLPATLLEFGIYKLDSIFSRYLAGSILIALVIQLLVAFSEELMKYMAVRKNSLKNPEFNEPADAMVYMMSSALGFAAIENMLILFSLAPYFSLEDAFFLSVIRLIGATLVHALTSGVVGYYLAISFFRLSKNKLSIANGLIIASLLHAFYNFSIISTGQTHSNLSLLTIGLILILLTYVVTAYFKELAAPTRIQKA